ncbi:MAG: LLM class flavin-dependent oxidoreductase [Holophagales bacterium]|nr:LLM class flavin-dependent oxidoreductase [Holophagales bacterium]MYD20676.1 LLM class flavin-dependent oxidoreductase [Holophagales bacterium]MYI33956.1 LLM class flavin-dependent oxidoreductase [Holophagales bacterium]
MTTTSEARNGLPAVSLAAVPGRRRLTLDLAAEIERRGFSGIYCPSMGDGLALCEAIALSTERIHFGTSIVNIYTRHVTEFASTASFIHEVSQGRFWFGVGVSHGPAHKRLGVSVGKPLADIRAFVDEVKAVRSAGELPPIVLATLRDRMIATAAEIGDGMVFANGARSRMAHSLTFAGEKAGDPAFFVGNMIPTVISDDRDLAAARNRKTLSRYALLPNYRNYWKAAGYVEEMEAVEQAVERGEADRIPGLLSDRWLADCTLFGTVAEVREGVERWFDAGIRTPILVPSSAAGNQIKAFEELFAAFDGS